MLEVSSTDAHLLPGGGGGGNVSLFHLVTINTSRSLLFVRHQQGWIWHFKRPLTKPGSVPVRSGPIRSDPIRSDPIRSDPVQCDQIRSGPIRSDPVLVFSTAISNIWHGMQKECVLSHIAHILNLSGDRFVERVIEINVTLLMPSLTFFCICVTIFHRFQDWSFMFVISGANCVNTELVNYHLQCFSTGKLAF